MLVARAIQGIGMSMFPIAFSLIRDQFPREKISIGQGIITSMFASGAVIGLSIGGTIIQHFGWQAAFFTIILISISLLIVIWRFIRVTPNEYQEHQRLHLNSGKDNNYNTKIPSSTMIDIKAASTLAATIT